MERFLMQKNQITGQSLVEVLVTVLCIGLGVIALLRFQSNLMFNYSLASNKADATTLAVKQLEILRNFQVLNNTSGYTSYQSIASGSSAITLNGTAYTVNWVVTPNITPFYKTINVTVSWTDRNSISRNISLGSNIAGIEPSNSASIM